MKFFNIDSRLLETAKKAEELRSEEHTSEQRKQGTLGIHKQPCQRNAP